MAACLFHVNFVLRIWNLPKKVLQLNFLDREFPFKAFFETKYVWVNKQVCMLICVRKKGLHRELHFNIHAHSRFLSSKTAAGGWQTKGFLASAVSKHFLTFSFIENHHQQNIVFVFSLRSTTPKPPSSSGQGTFPYEASCGNPKKLFWCVNQFNQHIKINEKHDAFTLSHKSSRCITKVSVWEAFAVKAKKKLLRMSWRCLGNFFHFFETFSSFFCVYKQNNINFPWYKVL